MAGRASRFPRCVFENELFRGTPTSEVKLRAKTRAGPPPTGEKDVAGKTDGGHFLSDLRRPSIEWKEASVEPSPLRSSCPTLLLSPDVFCRVFTLKTRRKGKDLSP